MNILKTSAAFAALTIVCGTAQADPVTTWTVTVNSAYFTDASYSGTNGGAGCGTAIPTNPAEHVSTISWGCNTTDSLQVKSDPGKQSVLDLTSGGYQKIDGASIYVDTSTKNIDTNLDSASAVFNLTFSALGGSTSDSPINVSFTFSPDCSNGGNKDCITLGPDATSFDFDGYEYLFNIGYMADSSITVGNELCKKEPADTCNINLKNNGEAYAYLFYIQLAGITPLDADVPEPGSLALLGAALGVMGFLRRRTTHA